MAKSEQFYRQKAGQLFKDKVATLPPELKQAKGFLKGSTVPAVRS